MNLKWKKRIAGVLATMLSCTTIMSAQAIAVQTRAIVLRPTESESELEVGDRGVTEDGIEWKVVSGKLMAISGYTGDSTTVTIPRTINGLRVVCISEGAFKGSSITSITIPALEWIGASAFEDCTALSNIEFQSLVIKINKNSFKGCTGLSHVFYNGTVDAWEMYMVHTRMIAFGNDDLLSCTFTAKNGDKFVPIEYEHSGYNYTYAEIETVEGFYSNGNNIGFEAEQVESLIIYDVYDDGNVIQREKIDMSLINFNGLTPKSVYDSRNNTFVYDVPVYYGDMPLCDEMENELCIPAYIGIMGDVNYDWAVDSRDAYYIGEYYSHIMSGNHFDKQQLSQNPLVEGLNETYDEFSAFLADMTQIGYADNWKLKKSDRTLDMTDAAIVLSFYAIVQTSSMDPDYSKEIFVSDNFDTSPVVVAVDGGYTEEEILSSKVKPHISISQIEIDADDLEMNNKVTVSVDLDGVKLDGNWCSMGIKLKYDPRLELIPYRADYPLKVGEAADYMVFMNESTMLDEDQSIFVSIYSYDNHGSVGTLFTCDFALPDDARPGDIFDVEIEYIPGSLFTNIENDEQGRLMQAYLFTEGIRNGYIKVKEPTSTTTTTTSTTTTTTTTTATTNTVKYFASIDEMCDMAAKDYEQKTGTAPADTKASVTENGTVSIQLLDENGKVLDVYVIDPETGIGISDSGMSVNLPQTGNNSLGTAAVAMAALGLIMTGAFAVMRSGIIRRKEE